MYTENCTFQSYIRLSGKIWLILLELTSAIGDQRFKVFYAKDISDRKISSQMMPKMCLALVSALWSKLTFLALLQY
jgi:hypothetical protein